MVVFVIDVNSNQNKSIMEHNQNIWRVIKLNQKDYKEIAGINKRWKNFFENRTSYELFCNEQADYFERELKSQKSHFFCADCGQTFTDGEGAHLCPDGERKFNRQQFLKDAGVK